MMFQLDDVLQKIKSTPKKHATFFIAIDGRGGSGKSTLADALKEKLDDVTIVHLDDVVHPTNSYRRQLRDQVIAPLKAGKPARYQKYDFDTKQFTEWNEVNPGGIVIIEGVSTLHDILYKEYDFSIWIECPAEVGFQRGVARDKAQGMDTADEWRKIWLPGEKRYVESQQPHKRANYIIDTGNNGIREAA